MQQCDLFALLLHHLLLLRQRCRPLLRLTLQSAHLAARRTVAIADTTHVDDGFASAFTQAVDLDGAFASTVVQRGSVLAQGFVVPVCRTGVVVTRCAVHAAFAGGIITATFTTTIDHCLTGTYAETVNFSEAISLAVMVVFGIYAGVVVHAGDLQVVTRTSLHTTNENFAIINSFVIATSGISGIRIKIQFNIGVAFSWRVGAAAVYREVPEPGAFTVSTEKTETFCSENKIACLYLRAPVASG